MKKIYKGHPRFLGLLEEMKALHRSKGADYATIASPFRNYVRSGEDNGLPGSRAALLRLSEKYHRIMNLIGEGKTPATAETVNETLMDLAAIALIVIVLREEEEEEWLGERSARGVGRCRSSNGRPRNTAAARPDGSACISGDTSAGAKRKSGKPRRKPGRPPGKRGESTNPTASPSSARKRSTPSDMPLATPPDDKPESA